MRSPPGLRLGALVSLLVVPPALSLPAPAFAQQARKAGVVTALRGQATVTRLALPRPAPLHFKDDVFFQDRVATERESVVRLLLGGKALVTIRELSDFTIFEEPNRARVELGLGRLALQVLRRLMRPGEEIEVRTPNAIAAVRGSFIDVLVAIRAGVLETTVTAFSDGVRFTNRATGVTEVLNANQQKGIVGTGATAQTTPTVTLTPEQARQQKKEATEAPKEKGHSDKPPEPLAAKVSSEKVDEATKLAAVLAPPLAAPTAPAAPPAPGEAAPPAAPAPADPTLTTASSPVAAATTTTTTAVTTTTSTTPTTSSTALCVQCSTVTTIATAPSAPTDVPDLAVSGGTLTLSAGQTLKTFSGSFTRAGTSPVVRLTNATVNSSGADFFKVAPGANVQLAGPLANIDPSTLQGPAVSNVISNGGFESGLTGWSVFNQAGGSGNFFSQSGALSPISGFPVPAPPGGTKTAMSDQTGPGVHILFQDVTVPVGSPVLRFALFVGNRASTFITPSPNSIDFSITPNQQARVDLMNPAAGIQDVGAGVLQNLFQTQPAETLVQGWIPVAFDLSAFAGQTARLRFVDVDNQNVFQLGVDNVSLASEFSLLRLDQSTFNNTTLSALISATGTAAQKTVIATSGDLVFLTRGSSLMTGGSLLKAIQSILAPGSGTLVWLSGGSTLTTGAAALDLTNTMVILTGPVIRATGGSVFRNTAGPVIQMNGGALVADALGQSDGTGTFNLTGTLLNLFNNATVTLRTLGESFPDLDQDVATFTLALNEPRVRLSSGSTLTLTGLGEELVEIGKRVGSIQTEPGIALIATDSTINLQGELLKLKAANSTATSALIQLSNTKVNQTGTADALIEVNPGGAGRGITMQTPLLEMIANSTIDPVASSGSVVHFTSGTLTSNTTLSFLFIESSTIATAGNLALLDGGFTLTLKGSFLSAAASMLSSGAGQSFVVITGSATLNTMSTTDALLALSGNGTLTTTGVTGHLVSVAGGTLTLGGQLLFFFGGSPSVNVAGDVLNVGPSGTGGTVTLLASAGTLVDVPAASATGLNVAGSVVNLASGTITLTSGSLLDVRTPGVVQTGSDVVKVAGAGTLTQAGSPFLINVVGTAIGPDPDTVDPSGLTLGTDMPLRPGGALLSASGASTNVSVERILGIDTALLAASAPLLDLTGVGAMVTSSLDALNLVSKANITSTAAALVRLDASTLTITNGHLFNLAGGSKLKTTAGDLLQMNNGATFNILNGTLLNVSGGSSAVIMGALVRFGGTGGNMLNVANSLAPTGFLNGIPVFSSLGGTAGFTVTNPTPLVGLNSLGTIKINGTVLPSGATGGVTGSLVAITGTGGGTVKIK